jgi:hypothetical protein
MTPPDAPANDAVPVTACGVATVTASAPVRAPADAVYDFLERLPNHALITGRGLRLEHVAPGGRCARIALRGPLGIRRTARTNVTRLLRPHGLGGTATVGRHTEAEVNWVIDRTPAGSLVTLTATILRAGAMDRLLLAFGGRWWLARSFTHAVALLAVAVERAGGTGATCDRIAG